MLKKKLKKVRKEIINHIKLLEKEQDIKILLAVESGSRAWGCPSPDSDYDVRIMFKRAKTEYLNITDRKDTIDYFHGELLDINGWDIKKVFRLIRKSNATPFEWAQSPIKYLEVDDFSTTVLNLCKEYFQPRHSVNHYKGIAKNSFWRSDGSTEIKLKKLFYVLRPIMAAKWIIQKNEIPPMDIPNLIAIVDDQKIVNHVNNLLEMKMTANEDYVHKMDPLIMDFIEAEIKVLDNIEIEGKKTMPPADSLNKKFKEIIED